MRRFTRTFVLLALLLALAACGGAATPEAAEPTEETEAAGAVDTEATSAAVPATEAPATTVTEPAPAAQGGGMLATIQSRGNLICGVNNTLPGFGNVDSAGNYTGFDVDFCKAIAAAILGDPDAVEYRPLT
ncbi:MAG: amino acid ABC transporter substrate-binding protein, partial [Ardenticatenaceae bacterium]